MFTDQDRVYLHAIYRRLHQVSTNQDTIAAEITALQAAVAQETSVNQSAVTLISGFSAQLAAAVAAAEAAGATSDQLTALNQLSQTVTTNSTALAAAVAANTTPAPAPAAP